ncbi:hypothetical protein H0H92_001611 [Tricholoma furcatifolium]|nr:hypothetical protein H0H92_001611 [Tricholoma furcatifolium]
MDQQDRQNETVQVRNTVDAVAQIFENDEPVVVSHAGISQYREVGGESACGLAALNCARLVFQRQRDGSVLPSQGEDLIHWLLSRPAAEEITSICDYWVNSSHLDIEDVVKVPFFRHSLSLLDVHHAQCEWAHFESLLHIMQAVSTTAAAIITKPPEIVACIKIPTLKGDIFVIFDSHVRPNHPSGSAFVFSRSVERIADYLSELFWVDYSSGGRGELLEWQDALMRQFCGHIVVPKVPGPTLEPNLNEALLEASMSILALNAEVADLKAKNSSLTLELQQAKKISEEKEVTGASNWTSTSKIHKDQRFGRNKTKKAIQNAPGRTPVAGKSKDLEAHNGQHIAKEYFEPRGKNCHNISISHEHFDAHRNSKSRQEEMDYALALQLEDEIYCETIAIGQGKHRKNEHKGRIEEHRLDDAGYGEHRAVRACSSSTQPQRPQQKSFAQTSSEKLNDVTGG